MPSAAATNSIFTASVEFDPADDFERFVKDVPARWVVCLLADEADRPVQLLCVKNFRYCLRRRLGGQVQVGPSKRVNYRELVRRVHWRRVDSAFEADWLYFEAARELFPNTYQGMVGFRPAWFVHVNPDAAFPRYTKTIDLTVRTGQLLGPLEDKHAAARLMHLLEDAFDLCRYYNVLVEAPNARACAYKEMGKCPAPCDGSIGMDQYRRLIAWSADVAVDPEPFVNEQTRRMQSAAADLRFESAAKVKAYADQLGALGKGPFRHVRRLSDFRYASLQRGPREGQAKAFVITPGRVREVAGLIAEPTRNSDLLRALLSDAAEPNAVDAVGTERIGVVAHHLFAAKQTSGVFLRADDLHDEKALAKAYRDVQKQKVKESADEEGLVKELQAL